MEREREKDKEGPRQESMALRYKKQSPKPQELKIANALKA